MKKVTVLLLALPLAVLPRSVQMKVALAVLAALTLSLGLMTGAGAEHEPESGFDMTIDSVALQGTEVAVTGTLTCVEATTRTVNVAVSQGDRSEVSGTASMEELECGPDRDTPYTVRVSGSEGEFRAGRTEVLALICPVGASPRDCHGFARGAFTLERSSPVSVVTKTVALTLYGTPGADDRDRMFSGEIRPSGYEKRLSIGFCSAVEGVDNTCQGEDTVYEGRFSVAKGSTITVWVSAGAFDDIYRATEIVNADMINHAWYDFDTNMGGPGTGPRTGVQQSGNDQQMSDDDQKGRTGQPGRHGPTGQAGQAPTQMPGTGGGGMEQLPLRSAAALAPLLLACAYMAREYRLGGTSKK